MAALAAASASSLLASPCVHSKRQQLRVVSNFNHFSDVVRNDFEFLKKGINWANQTFRIPQISKAVEYAVWLRNLEDPHTLPLEPPHWPQPPFGFLRICCRDG